MTASARTALPTRLLAGMAAAVAVVAWLLAATPARATVPGANGAIAFVRDGDIWLVGADGAGARRLTTDPAPEGSPAWSPDGTTVAFERRVGTRWHIFAVDLHDGPARQLTDAPVSDRDPAFSPDGGRISFSRDSPRLGRDLMVMPSGGGAPVLVRAGEPSQLRGSEWTPDGAWILFGEIYDNGVLSRVRPDGLGYEQLGGPPVLGSGGNWWDAPSASPGGEWVAFAQRAYDEGTGEVEGAQRLGVMRPDGRDVRLLPALGALDEEPSWSPDGSRIALETNRHGDDEIYTVAADGSDPRRVTERAGDDTEPAWQPLAAPAGSPPLGAAAPGPPPLAPEAPAAPVPGASLAPPLGLRPFAGPPATRPACRRARGRLAANVRGLAAARAAVRGARTEAGRRRARLRVVRLTAARAPLAAARRRACARP